jgi:ribosomal protein S6--L-glutamate ligase
LKVLREWEKTGQSGFVSQALIASGGNVLRAVLLEDRIITYWKRHVLQGSLITTISRNAFVDKDWRKDLQEKGRVQTKIFSQRTGINVAAIDYVFHMKDPEPQPLILEVNYYFGRRGLGGSLNYYVSYSKPSEWLRRKSSILLSSDFKTIRSIILSSSHPPLEVPFLILKNRRPVNRSPFRCP